MRPPVKPHHSHFHGPGRQRATAYIAINTRLCQACWKCVGACPKSVIGKTNFIFHKHARIVRPALCTGCLACTKVCPAGAVAAVQKANCQFED